MGSTVVAEEGKEEGGRVVEEEEKAEVATAMVGVAMGAGDSWRG